jgi:peptidyl-prolyl cis-trans isomerase C
MKRLLHCLIILSACNYSSIFAASTEQPENPILASVNGADISTLDVKYFIQQQNRQTPPQQALMEMINIELLTQAAKNEGLLKDEALAMKIKLNTSGLIASYYLNKFLGKLEISDEELQKRYEEQYKSKDPELEYNANHILLKTEAEAKEIIKQLDQGADFSKLAKDKSTGPSGKNGGELGWFSKGDMVAPFSEAASKLKSGSYSAEPVKSKFGWHVILLNETRKVDPPAFESVKEQLYNTIASESIRNMIKTLHDKSNVELTKAK